jgi:hypothetical protein
MLFPLIDLGICGDPALQPLSRLGPSPVNAHTIPKWQNGKNHMRYGGDLQYFAPHPLFHFWVDILPRRR